MAKKLPPNAQVGHNVWIVRLQTDATQQDLADALGLYREAITDLERGDRRLSLPEARLAAAYLGCTLDRLAHALPSRIM